MVGSFFFVPTTRTSSVILELPVSKCMTYSNTWCTKLSYEPPLCRCQFSWQDNWVHGGYYTEMVLGCSDAYPNNLLYAYEMFVCIVCQTEYWIVWLVCNILPNICILTVSVQRVSSLSCIFEDNLWLPNPRQFFSCPPVHCFSFSLLMPLYPAPRHFNW